MTLSFEDKEGHRDSEMVRPGKRRCGVNITASSPDTTGVMRPIEGGYIYNLRVPISIDGVPVQANDVLTIRILPFGSDSPGVGMYVLLKIRK